MRKMMTHKFTDDANGAMSFTTKNAGVQNFNFNEFDTKAIEENENGNLMTVQEIEELKDRIV